MAPRTGSFFSRKGISLTSTYSTALSISLYLCPLPVSKCGSRGSNGLSHSFINIYGLASWCSRNCSGPVCLFAVVLFCFVFCMGVGVVRGDICVFMKLTGSGFHTDVFRGDICAFMKHSSLGQASTHLAFLLSNLAARAISGLKLDLSVGIVQVENQG